MNENYYLFSLYKYIHTIITLNADKYISQLMKAKELL